jgi:hypothetical protein
METVGIGAIALVPWAAQPHSEHANIVMVIAENNCFMARPAERSHARFGAVKAALGQCESARHG